MGKLPSGLESVIGQVLIVTVRDAEWYKLVENGGHTDRPSQWWYLDRTYSRYMAKQLLSGAIRITNPAISVAGQLVDVVWQPRVEVYHPPGPKGGRTWTRAKGWGLHIKPLLPDSTPGDRLVLLGSVSYLTKMGQLRTTDAVSA